MFYFLIILKISIFYFLPIFSMSFKGSKKLLSISSLIQALWLIYAAFLSYIPFYYYYYQNEVNIQHLIPEYFLLIIFFLFLLLPVIYFISMRYVFSKIRLLLKIIGIAFLILSSIIIFGIETFNYSKRVELEKICYSNHNLSKEKLECCLEAEYIWNEGFSYLNDTPENCIQFMNWNE